MWPTPSLTLSMNTNFVCRAVAIHVTCDSNIFKERPRNGSILDQQWVHHRRIRYEVIGTPYQGTKSDIERMLGIYDRIKHRVHIFDTDFRGRSGYIYGMNRGEMDLVVRAVLQLVSLRCSIIGRSGRRSFVSRISAQVIHSAHRSLGTLSWARTFRRLGLRGGFIVRRSRSGRGFNRARSFIRLRCGG